MVSASSYSSEDIPVLREGSDLLRYQCNMTLGVRGIFNVGGGGVQLPT